MAGTLVTIVGPTAIGKTHLAIVLAKHFNTEILSADSRQFYKEMTIGTAVPPEDMLADVPHHFIQHKSILDDYNVGDFERDALKTLENLFKAQDVVVMAGGSGLYVDAVTRGLDYFPEVDEDIREHLNQSYAKGGIKILQKKLGQLDPDYYEKVDLANPRRIIRALGVCLASGKPYSSFLNKRQVKRPFNSITLGLTADRTVLYDRINKRVDLMMEQGLLAEVRALVQHQDRNALQTVGYKELFKYLSGNWELEFAVREIKKNTRRYAKRQITWLKKNTDMHWIPYNTAKEGVIQHVKRQLKP
ncbi:MAG TPA: tRNA (adenosine(37)-N6)-dimethylallyltransferase MiaA [Eudoraea sp.]|nr:tRNA (adenosine(37)-N6)-dimethylallyltransferase MiaA [Eudoraea sp.]